MIRVGSDPISEALTRIGRSLTILHTLIKKINLRYIYCTVHSRLSESYLRIQPGSCAVTRVKRHSVQFSHPDRSPQSSSFSTSIIFETFPTLRLLQPTRYATNNWLYPVLESSCIANRGKTTYPTLGRPIIDMKRKRAQSHSYSISEASLDCTHDHDPRPRLLYLLKDTEELKETSAPSHSESVEEESDYDSLFDDVDTPEDSSSSYRMSGTLKRSLVPASVEAPNIPGLFFTPSNLIPVSLAQDIWDKSMKMYFSDNDVNQVMLFQRAQSPAANTSSGTSE